MKYIIVTGGQFANKGAQAMTYIAADEIAKRWPQCRMLMYCNPSKIPNKEDYRFGFISDQGHNLIHSRIYRDVLRNTEAIIDISGYAIGSDWSERGNIYFIKNRLIDAKRYGIPVYLMPQSFGPFAFKGKYKKIIMMLFRHYLPYAKCIMAREADGELELKSKFSLNNIVRTPDLVLQNSGINPANIYVGDHPVREFTLEGDKKVAVIPNRNNMRYADQEEMIGLYHNIIKKLSSLGYRIYLIYHSSDDAEICRQIFKTSMDNNTELIDEDLDCLEFDKLVGQFDFVIASRYHSVVHAYRRRIPAIVLGWAVKYRELMEAVQQEQFLFDFRTRIDENAVLNSINDLSGSVEDNKKTIDKMMSVIQKDNVFDFIKLKSEL